MTKKIHTNPIILLITGLVVIILGLLAWSMYQKPSNVPKGFIKVKGFHYVEEGQVTCMAIIPECSYCMGTLIDKECYVDKNQLSPAEQNKMGL